MPRTLSFNKVEKIDQAMILFWENGFTNTSLKNLEEKLGLRAPSIYNTFGSKEALLLKCLDHYIESIVDQRINTILLSGNNPILALKKFFTSVPNSKLNFGCLLNMLSIEKKLPLKVREKIEIAQDKIYTSLLVRVREAREMDQLKRDIKSKEIASFLFISYQGVLVLDRVRNTQKYINDLFKGIEK